MVDAGANRRGAQRPDRARATLAEALAANPGDPALEELRRGL